MHKHTLLHYFRCEQFQNCLVDDVLNLDSLVQTSQKRTLDDNDWLKLMLKVDYYQTMIGAMFCLL